MILSAYVHHAMKKNTIKKDKQMTRKYDGYSIKAKDRNFYFCLNKLKYEQSCKTPLQTNAKYLYLKDGYIFPSDTLIGKEIIVKVENIEYGKVEILEG